MSMIIDYAQRRIHAQAARRAQDGAPGAETEAALLASAGGCGERAGIIIFPGVRRDRDGAFATGAKKPRRRARRKRPQAEPALSLADQSAG